MRIIEACNSPIRAVSVSPDGRFVAASSDDALGVFHWATGEALFWPRAYGSVPQIAFTADGWVVYCMGHALYFERLHTDAPPARHPGAGERYAGGLAVSPDGKLFVAVVGNEPKRAKLLRCSLPAMRPLAGFDDWSPFQKVAFSTNGHFIAGIWPGTREQYYPRPGVFELHYAASGGADYRFPPMGSRAFDAPGFVSFNRDSSLCAFGWKDEFHVLDISTGTSRYLSRVEAQFRDAAFTGSGQHLATVDDGGGLKMWEPKTWQVVREYDWGCGPLTCLAFTADGSAGVCGTADGQLVQFDVDE